jgi:transcriptional regulator with XRE-family HTH domain
MGYRGKLDAQDQARRLRAEGWTMPEIAVELGVSHSSVSMWTREVPYVPRRPRRRVDNGPNRLARERAAEILALREWGREAAGDLSERDLLIAGAALYAGEGAKRDGEVIFTNTDPRVTRLFLAWLRAFFEIDESRLRIRLYLHQGLDLDAATSWWSGLTAIPASQFGSPYRASPDRSSPRRTKHPMGCASVRYGCARTHRGVMGLVEALLPCEPSFRGGAIGSAGHC